LWRPPAQLVEYAGGPKVCVVFSKSKNLHGKTLFRAEKKYFKAAMHRRQGGLQWVVSTPCSALGKQFNNSADTAGNN